MGEAYEISISPVGERQLFFSPVYNVVIHKDEIQTASK